MSIEGTRSSRLAATKAVGELWWYFLIRGLFLLAAGLFLLFKPVLTAVIFAQLLGLFILLDGAMAVAAGVMGRAKSRTWSMVRGGLMCAAGLFLLLRPTLATSLASKTVFYVVGPIIIILGVFEIVATVRARKAKRKPKGGILNGLLMSVFGIFLIIAPLFFGKLLLQLIAVVAIVLALVMVTLAFKFHKRARRIEIQE